MTKYPYVLVDLTEPLKVLLELKTNLDLPTIELGPWIEQCINTLLYPDLAKEFLSVLAYELVDDDELIAQDGHFYTTQGVVNQLVTVFTLFQSKIIAQLKHHGIELYPYRFVKFISENSVDIVVIKPA